MFRRLVSFVCASLLLASQAGALPVNKYIVLQTSSKPLVGSQFDAKFTSNVVNGGLCFLGKSQVSCSSQMTIARASTKECQWSDGHYVQTPANTLCVSDLGASSEEAATNMVRNARAEGGSVGVSPTNWSATGGSGLTITAVAVMQINGIDGMAYDVAGTATGVTAVTISLESSSQIVAASADVWTLSPYMAILSGSTSGISKISNRALWVGAGTNGDGSDVSTSLTATPQRVVDTLTAPASTTFIQPRVQITPVNLQVVSFRIWIGWPQAVKTNHVTSPVVAPVGSPAASTRAQDLITLTGSANIAALNAASVYAKTFGLTGGVSPYVVHWFGGAFNGFSVPSNAFASNGTNTASATLGSGTTAGVVKTSFSFDSTSITARSNGGTLATTANAWSGNTTSATIGGSATGNRQLNGFIQELSFGNVKSQFDGITQ